MMNLYEYKLLTANDFNLDGPEETLNALGAQGWRVVDVRETGILMERVGEPKMELAVSVPAGMKSAGEKDERPVDLKSLDSKASEIAEEALSRLAEDLDIPVGLLKIRETGSKPTSGVSGNPCRYCERRALLNDGDLNDG